MKKFIAILLLTAFIFSNSAVYSEVLEGHAEKTDTYEQRLQKELFTGEVEHLERKDIINGNKLFINYYSPFKYNLEIFSQ